MIIMIYASKYYDPAKAHEYYMQHRVLKGRKKSTATLNETGKKARDYVKEQITTERKNVSEAESRRHEKAVEQENKSYKQRVLEKTSATTLKIKNIQKKFSKLTPAQKRILGPKLKAELMKMKNENANIRAKLQSEHSKNIESLRETTKQNQKNISTKYSKLYEDEVEKMKSDSSMINQKKTKTKKSTSTKSSKTTSKKTSTSTSDANKAKYQKIISDAMARYEQRKKKK